MIPGPAGYGGRTRRAPLFISYCPAQTLMMSAVIFWQVVLSLFQSALAGLCGPVLNAANGGRQGEEASVPEEIGKHAARKLLDEVHRGGVVDSGHQVQSL